MRSPTSPDAALAASRVLFALWIVDELWCARMRHEPPDAAAPWPRATWLMTATNTAPLLWRPARLRPLRWLAALLQVAGLVLMAGARRQLIRAGSFGWGPEAATRPQRDGWYRHLEHPIYTGMVIHLLGWALVNPLALVAAWQLYAAEQRAVPRERAHLARLGVSHRGLDSWLWGDE